MIALPPQKDGTVHAVLEIAPDPGWHTYWKVPGSSGIPPQITVHAGGNIALQRIDFPAPRVFTDGRMRDFGYDSAVLLPLTLKQAEPGKPATLAADVFVGLCSTICVPFQTTLSLKLDPSDTADAREAALLNAARASLPEPEANDFGVVESHLSADGRAVTVSLILPPGADAASARFIVTGPDGLVFGEHRVVKTEGNHVTIAAAPVFLKDGVTLKGAPLQLLAEAAGRAMETSIRPQ